MAFSPRLSAASAALALCFSLPTAAHAQFLSIFQSVGNVVGQVANKATGRVFAGEGHDLQEAYDKYFSQIDAQTVGMDEASKRQHRKLVEQQWPAIETALLTANAQLQAKKDAPLLDIADVAKAAVSGAAAQAGMNAAIVSHTAAPMASVLQSNAVTGVISGAETALRGALTGSDASVPALAGLEFKPTEATHPLVFFGAHPSTLKASDLYRANGFIGWKRIEQNDTAQAYAHVAGQGDVQYAVYHHDAQTGSVTSAFRVFKVSPAAFGSAVQEYTQMLGATPRYASQGSVLRAVWESGAFVTADGQKITAGWSHTVPQLYASAVQP